MKFLKPISVLIITGLLLAAFIACESWIGFTTNYPPFISGVGAVLLLLLPCLFFINLGFAVFQSKNRITHIIMSLLIIITGFWFFPLSVKWHQETEQRWFFQRGMQTFQAIVDEVGQNKAVLTSISSPLKYIVNYNHVLGYTNADGSMIFLFASPGGYTRAGYLYCSGNQMTLNHDKTNEYFLPDNPYRFYHHLTNSWYKF